MRRFGNLIAIWSEELYGCVLASCDISKKLSDEEMLKYFVENENYEFIKDLARKKLGIQ